jgi:3-oxoacyl-[acyl-carrier protein] reductase
MASASKLLDGKWALVTGANRGIGRAIIRLFAAQGASVLAAGRDQAVLESLCQTIKDEYGVSAVPIIVDVAKPDEVKAAFQKITGITKALDVVVNNAGVLDNNLLGMTRHETVERVFSVNTFGTIYVTQYASRLMMPRKSGSIINLSSIVGVNGNDGQVVYSGSKAAVVGITRSAAKELAPYQIRVNAIAPGFIETDMIRSLSPEKFQERVNSIRMKRIGTPEEVANCALFLASDLSLYVTGQVIGVDGGMVI